MAGVICPLQYCRDSIVCEHHWAISDIVFNFYMPCDRQI